MKKTKSATKKKKTKRGRKPDVLILEGDWRDLMKKALQKKKPASGWPK